MARYLCRTITGETKKVRNKIDSYYEALEISHELGIDLVETGWISTTGWLPKSHPDLRSNDGIIYVCAKDCKALAIHNEPRTEGCKTYIMDVNSVIER